MFKQFSNGVLTSGRCTGHGGRGSFAFRQRQQRHRFRDQSVSAPCARSRHEHRRRQCGRLTITLRAGTYNGSATCACAKPLTLRSYSGERAHILPTSPCPTGVVVQIDRAASGSRLAGLSNSAAACTAASCSKPTGGVPATPAPGHPGCIVLEDLYVHDASRDGIKLTPRTNQVTIRRNEDQPHRRSGGARHSRSTIATPTASTQIPTCERDHRGTTTSDISTTGLYFRAAPPMSSCSATASRTPAWPASQPASTPAWSSSDLAVNPPTTRRWQGHRNFVRNTDYEGTGMYSTIAADRQQHDRGDAPGSAIRRSTTLRPGLGRTPNVRRRPKAPSWHQQPRDQDGGTCVEIPLVPRPGARSGTTSSPISTNAYYDRSGSCRFVDNRPGADGIRNDNGTRGSNFALWRSFENADAASSGALGRRRASATGQPGHQRPTRRCRSSLTTSRKRQPRSAPYDIGAHEASPPPGGVPEQLRRRSEVDRGTCRRPGPRGTFVPRAL